jgi:hypothetical protein
MANWWDWSGESADRDEARRQSVAAALLAKAEAQYDSRVQQVRDDNAEFLRLRGGGPFDAPQPGFYRSLPPEVRMGGMYEAGQLTPKNPSPGYADFLGEAVNYPLEIGARPRDTLIRSAQEMRAGNYGAALGYAAASPVSTLVPYVAAGRAGDDDDWREAGRRAGVSERDLLMIDIGTDPTTYVGWGALRAVPRMASRADDILRSLRSYGGQMRYGRGVPTYIEDAAGNTIMRSRNSPGGMLERLALPSP